MAQLILFNKPYGVLSQFTDRDSRSTLANYIPIKKCYPAGRLDKDSEGLLLLTGDGKLQNTITHPRKKMPKYYWVQIEGEISKQALQTLQSGVELNDGMTSPAEIRCVAQPGNLWPRNPPIRVRKSIPTQWLEMVIREGRNRQIRRMTAAVGCPTLRLVRFKIGPWELGQLSSGEFKIIDV